MSCSLIRGFVEVIVIQTFFPEEQAQISITQEQVYENFTSCNFTSVAATDKLAPIQLHTI